MANTINLKTTDQYKFHQQNVLITLPPSVTVSVLNGAVHYNNHSNGTGSNSGHNANIKQSNVTSSQTTSSAGTATAAADTVHHEYYPHSSTLDLLIFKPELEGHINIAEYTTKPVHVKSTVTSSHHRRNHKSPDEEQEIARLLPTSTSLVCGLYPTNSKKSHSHKREVKHQTMLSLKLKHPPVVLTALTPENDGDNTYKHMKKTRLMSYEEIVEEYCSSRSKYYEDDRRGGRREYPYSNNASVFGNHPVVGTTPEQVNNCFTMRLSDLFMAGYAFSDDELLTVTTSVLTAVRFLRAHDIVHNFIIPEYILCEFDDGDDQADTDKSHHPHRNGGVNSTNPTPQPRNTRARRVKKTDVYSNEDALEVSLNSSRLGEDDDDGGDDIESVSSGSNDKDDESANGYKRGKYGRPQSHRRCIVNARLSGLEHCRYLSYMLLRGKREEGGAKKKTDDETTEDETFFCYTQHNRKERSCVNWYPSTTFFSHACMGDVNCWPSLLAHLEHLRSQAAIIVAKHQELYPLHQELSLTTSPTMSQPASPAQQSQLSLSTRQHKQFRRSNGTSPTPTEAAEMSSMDHRNATNHHRTPTLDKTNQAGTFDTHPLEKLERQLQTLKNRAIKLQGKLFYSMAHQHVTQEQPRKPDLADGAAAQYNIETNERIGPSSQTQAVKDHSNSESCNENNESTHHGPPSPTITHKNESVDFENDNSFGPLARIKTPDFVAATPDQGRVANAIQNISTIPKDPEKKRGARQHFDGHNISLLPEDIVVRPLIEVHGKNRSEKVTTNSHYDRGLIVSNSFENENNAETSISHRLTELYDLSVFALPKQLLQILPPEVFTHEYCNAQGTPNSALKEMIACAAEHIQRKSLEAANVWSVGVLILRLIAPKHHIGEQLAFYKHYFVSMANKYFTPQETLSNNARLQMQSNSAKIARTQSQITRSNSETHISASSTPTPVTTGPDGIPMNCPSPSFYSGISITGSPFLGLQAKSKETTEISVKKTLDISKNSFLVGQKEQSTATTTIHEAAVIDVRTFSKKVTLPLPPSPLLFILPQLLAHEEVRTSGWQALAYIVQWETLDSLVIDPFTVGDFCKFLADPDAEEPKGKLIQGAQGHHSPGSSTLKGKFAKTVPKSLFIALGAARERGEIDIARVVRLLHENHSPRDANALHAAVRIVDTEVAIRVCDMLLASMPNSECASLLETQYPKGPTACTALLSAIKHSSGKRRWQLFDYLLLRSHELGGQLKIQANKKTLEFLMESDNRRGIKQMLSLWRGEVVYPDKFLSLMIDTAARQGAVSCCIELISQKVPQDHRAKELSHAVRTAAENSHIGACEGLIEYAHHVSDLIDQSEIATVALFVACANDLVDVLTMALKLNANPLAFDAFGTTVTHICAWKGHTSSLSQLFTHIPKSVSELIANQLDAEGLTALHIAAERGQHGVCDMLLKNGAHANATDRFGNTPLHLAAANDNTSCLKALISEGGFLEAINKDGETPVFTAAKRGCVECIRDALLPNGALLGHRNQHLSPYDALLSQFNSIMIEMNNLHRKTHTKQMMVFAMMHCVLITAILPIWVYVTVSWYTVILPVVFEVGFVLALLTFGNRVSDNTTVLHELSNELEPALALVRSADAGVPQIMGAAVNKHVKHIIKVAKDLEHIENSDTKAAQDLLTKVQDWVQLFPRYTIPTEYARFCDDPSTVGKSTAQSISARSASDAQDFSSSDAAVVTHAPYKVTFPTGTDWSALTFTKQLRRSDINPARLQTLRNEYIHVLSDAEANSEVLTFESPFRNASTFFQYARCFFRSFRSIMVMRLVALIVMVMVFTIQGTVVFRPQAAESFHFSKTLVDKCVDTSALSCYDWHTASGQPFLKTSKADCCFGGADNAISDNDALKNGNTALYCPGLDAVESRENRTLTKFPRCGVNNENDFFCTNKSLLTFGMQRESDEGTGSTRRVYVRLAPTIEAERIDDNGEPLPMAVLMLSGCTNLLPNPDVIIETVFLDEIELLREKIGGSFLIGAGAVLILAQFAVTARWAMRRSLQYHLDTSCHFENSVAKLLFASSTHLLTGVLCCLLGVRLVRHRISETYDEVQKMSVSLSVLCVYPGLSIVWWIPRVGPVAGPMFLTVWLGLVMVLALILLLPQIAAIKSFKIPYFVTDPQRSLASFSDTSNLRVFYVAICIFWILLALRLLLAIAKALQEHDAQGRYMKLMRHVRLAIVKEEEMKQLKTDSIDDARLNKVIERFSELELRSSRAESDDEIESFVGEPNPTAMVVMVQPTRQPQTGESLLKESK